MWIDRHRVAYLAELSARVGTKPAAELGDLRDLVEVYLAGIYAAATPAARETFAVRVGKLPQDDRPFAAVRVPGGAAKFALGGAPGAAAPPALVLLMGAEDDEPDQGGDRLPERGTPAAAPWQALFEALDRWDVAAIQAHIGPFGWQAPNLPLEIGRDEGIAVEYPPAKTSFTPRSMTQPSPVPTPNNAPPSAAPSSSASTVAGAPAPSSTSPAWKVAGATAAVGVGGAAVYGLSRLIRHSDPPLPSDMSQTPRAAMPGQETSP